MQNKITSLEEPFLLKRFDHLDKKLKNWGRFSTAKLCLNLAIQSLKGLQIAKEEITLLVEFRER